LAQNGAAGKPSSTIPVYGSSLLLANPIATSDSNGVLINIDAKTIIENSRGFKLSPESCQRQNEPALNSSLPNC
jgi:hypothetical protein